MATKKGKSVMDWENAADSSTPTVFYRMLNVEGLEIFYREAGPRDAPTVLLGPFRVGRRSGSDCVVDA